MIKLYRRLSSACHTINQLNRLHIAFENRMTPLELVELRKFLVPHDETGMTPPESDLSPTSAPKTLTALINETEKKTLQFMWINNLYQKFLLAGRTSPMPFTRRKLNGIYFFSCPGKNQSKTALACFTGIAHRMMMPTPIFLQNVALPDADIIYLSAKTGGGYHTGIAGLGGNLGTSIKMLGSLLKAMGYERTATLGVSAGGLPSILAGLQWEADAVLSIGAGNPNDAKWLYRADDPKNPGFLNLPASHAPRQPDIYLVHGALHLKDAAANKAIAAKIKTKEILSVPDSSHNALYHLAERGLLSKLLERTVLAPAPN